MSVSINSVKNNSIINQIEFHIVNIRIKLNDRAAMRHKEAALSLIRTHRLISDSPVLDKRLSSIMIETLQGLVPLMTVKTFEDITSLLKTKKETS